MTANTEIDLLTIEDVAKKLQIGEEQVRRLARGKKLAAVKVGDLWRFTPSDVADYVARNRTAASEGSSDVGRARGSASGGSEHTSTGGG